MWDDKTVSEARSYIYANRHEGVVCPCCHQFAKVYKRTITSSMCRGLIAAYWLDRELPGEFFHKNKIGKDVGINFGGGDFAKLVYWGLIVPRTKTDADDIGGRTSGYWRITDAGKKFVEMETRVPKYMYLYDGKCVFSSEVTTDMRDCLGVTFNYDELMAKYHH